MVEEYCRVVSILIRQPTARLSNHPPDFFPKNLFSFFPFFSFLLAYISCDRQIGPLGLLNSKGIYEAVRHGYEPRNRQFEHAGARSPSRHNGVWIGARISA